MDNDYFVIMQYINREIEILKLIRDCITEKMLCIQEEMKVDKKADKRIIVSMLKKYSDEYEQEIIKCYDKKRRINKIFQNHK